MHRVVRLHTVAASKALTLPPTAAGLHYTYPKDKRAALYKHARLTEEKEGPSPAVPPLPEADDNDVVVETRTLLQSRRSSPEPIEP